MSEKCIIEGCCRLAIIKVHKLCRSHYVRWCRKGDVGSGTFRKRVIRAPYKPHRVKSIGAE